MRRKNVNVNERYARAAAETAPNGGWGETKKAEYTKKNRVRNRLQPGRRLAGVQVNSLRESVREGQVR